MKVSAKSIVLITIGSVLTLSIVIFGVLLLKANRKGDFNNEDALLKLARAAVGRDDPPAAALYFHRLTKLNPFNDGYQDAYFHALVRMRDFRTLDAYTNAHPVKVSVSAEAVELEKLIAEGRGHLAQGSNDLAVAVFEQATNLNYFAATPELVDGELRRGRFAEALDILRAYSGRFKEPRLFVQGAELSALARRPDLIGEFASRFPASGRPSVAFGLYCDALAAWVRGDLLESDVYLRQIKGEVVTPFAKLIALEVSCAGHDPDRVNLAWIDFLPDAEFLDFRYRGEIAVKAFVAAHFPDKAPIGALGTLADEVLKSGARDVELTRVSLLAKFAAKTLLPRHLEVAEASFPADRGIRLIREAYRASLTGNPGK